MKIFAFLLLSLIFFTSGKKWVGRAGDEKLNILLGWPNGKFKQSLEIREVRLKPGRIRFPQYSCFLSVL